MREVRHVAGYQGRRLPGMREANQMTADLSTYQITFDRTARKCIEIQAPSRTAAIDAINSDWAGAVLGEDAVQIRLVEVKEME